MAKQLSFHKKLFYCRRVISLAVLMSFLLTSILPCARAQEIFMPPPGTLVGMSKGYVPLAVKGLKIYPDNPFRFDFILDTGNSSLAGEELKKESQLLIKYFLAALTVPDDDQWVNLSPTEKNRIIPEHFGYTDMGRDLLAQDYLLKQLSATLTKPDTELGKKYWEGVWSREASYVKRDAKDQGPRFTNDASRATLSKVWVMPDHAKVYESGTIAFITESHLKVMMEGDLENSLTPPSPLFKKEGERSSVQISPFLIKEGEKSVTQVSPSLVKEGVRGSSEIFRNLILPQIEKEVNEGKNFARLRQVYQSMIMAAWYKKKLKDSLLSKIYVGTNKVAGVDIDDKDAKQKIYNQYLEAFKKGVYNIIQEQYDAKTDETVPRKYFSGGVMGGRAVSSSTTFAETSPSRLVVNAAGSSVGQMLLSKVELKYANNKTGLNNSLKITNKKDRTSGILEQGFEELQASSPVSGKDKTDWRSLGILVVAGLLALAKGIELFEDYLELKHEPVQIITASPAAASRPLQASSKELNDKFPRPQVSILQENLQKWNNPAFAKEKQAFVKQASADLIKVFIESVQSGEKTFDLQKLLDKARERSSDKGLFEAFVQSGDLVKTGIPEKFESFLHKSGAYQDGIKQWLLSLGNLDNLTVDNSLQLDALLYPVSNLANNGGGVDSSGKNRTGADIGVIIAEWNLRFNQYLDESQSWAIAGNLSGLQRAVLLQMYVDKITTKREILGVILRDSDTFNLIISDKNSFDSYMFLLGLDYGKSQPFGSEIKASELKVLTTYSQSKIQYAAQLIYDWNVSRPGFSHEDPYVEGTILENPGNIIKAVELTKKGMSSQQIIDTLIQERKDELTSTEKSGSSSVGGIDMNRKNLDLQTSGKGADFNMPSDPAEWQNIKFDGFVPVILQIIPANLPLLLGVKSSPKAEQVSLLESGAH